MKAQKKRDLQVLTLFVVLSIMTLIALFALQGILPAPLLSWGELQAGF